MNGHVQRTYFSNINLQSVGPNKVLTANDGFSVLVLKLEYLRVEELHAIVDECCDQRQARGLQNQRTEKHHIVGR